jgi:hypothetical protein
MRTIAIALAIFVILGGAARADDISDVIAKIYEPYLVRAPTSRRSRAIRISARG